MTHASNTQSKNALAVIPARYASTRLPGKPLLADTGKPLIQHVVENTKKSKCVARVVVATDDQRIYDAVKKFGGEVVMTGEHDNGTSRIAEAIENIDGSDLIVNVQGDEPEINPLVIDALVMGLAQDDSADMATLYAPFADNEDVTNPNIVKVIKDKHNRAIYFSRAMIPHDRDNSSPPYYKHPGLYAYRRAFLQIYRDLSPTPLERAEKLEQLRVIEHGYKIALIGANAPHPGIDTPEQYTAFVARMKLTHG